MRGSEYAELRALASIVEHGSFARAAKQLGVSPSALSQTIRGLETRLGVRLLNRTTRSVAPSEAGAQLLARIVPVFGELDAAVADVREGRERAAGLLRINAPRAAALYRLAPVLGAFHRAHPEIVLDLVVEDRITDIVAERFDAGIRLGESLAKDMVAIKLGGEMQQIAVAAPHYLAAHPAPRHPRDLAQHRCINIRMPTDLNLYRWEFERRRKQLDVGVEGPLIVNDPELALAAALQGIGIAYLFRDRAQAFIDDGELIPLLETWSPPFPGFYLYHPSRRQLRAPLRAFIDFIRAALARET